MKRACVPNVDSSSINANLNGRVVHITGKIALDETARDPELNFIPDSKAVVLKRTVEILHWKENKTTEKESTTYTYELVWTEKDIDSRDFQEAGHANPPRCVALHSKKFYAAARVGAYRLSRPVLRQLTSWKAADLTAGNTAALSPAITRPPAGASFAGLRDRFIYVASGTSGQPAGAPGGYGSTGSLGSPGDVRVSYDVIAGGDISIAGVLQEGTFRPFTERDAHTVSGRLEEQLISDGDGDEDDPDKMSDSAKLSKLLSLCNQLYTEVLLVEERIVGADQLFSIAASRWARSAARARARE